jgi:hypothetical protein
MMNSTMTPTRYVPNEEACSIRFHLYKIMFHSGSFTCNYLYTSILTRLPIDSECLSTLLTHGLQVLQSIGQSIDRTLGALDTFSAVITTMANSTNQTFPFVRVHQFAAHAAKFLPQTGASIIYFIPIVPFESRLEWEQYAARNNTELPIFVTETLDYQENWSNFPGPLPQNYTWPSSDAIFSDFGDIPYNVSRPDGVEAHLPMWQTFPLIMTVYPPANWGKHKQPIDCGEACLLCHKKRNLMPQS